MRTLASLLAAAALAAFGFTAPAGAGKPTTKVDHDHYTSGFSAAFVAVDGSEVGHSYLNGEGSKGDLDNDGNWGVITGELVVDTTYEICLAAVEAPDGVDNPLWLADAPTDGTYGNLYTTGSMDVADAGDYQAPSLQIRADTGEDECDGVLLQESGTTVVIGTP